MKRLYLIRHAKSSWSDAEIDDFHRPLNARGKKDGPAMARRLADAGIRPDVIISSPATRAKTTAGFMAEGTGYGTEAICYDKNLYLGSVSYHCQVLAGLFTRFKVVFLVGHNDTISVLAEHLSGRILGNVPTCGVVALDFAGQGDFSQAAGSGDLVFFWYPKDQSAGHR